MTDEEYHSHEAISRTDLADFDESRRWYEATRITKTHDREFNSDKVCLRTGTNVHSLLLEPDSFERRAVLIPDDVLTSNGHRRGKAWEAWKADTLAETPDAIIMLEKELIEAKAIAASVQREIGNLLHAENAIREKPIFWTESVDGVTVHCRCKPDLLIETPSGMVAVDIKTTRDHTKRKFSWSMRDLRYWLQDAHYTAGIEAMHKSPVNRFLFAAVRTSGHFPCRVYELTIETRDKAAARRADLLKELQRCIQTNDWSDDGEGVITSLDIDF